MPTLNIRQNFSNERHRDYTSVCNFGKVDILNTTYRKLFTSGSKP